jgi:hypothetical protein
MNPNPITSTLPASCDRWGNSVTPGMLEGLCPSCLLLEGAAETHGLPSFEPPPLEETRNLFPQLEILAVVGKGGMGAVYQARQPSLDRFSKTPRGFGRRDRGFRKQRGAQQTFEPWLQRNADAAWKVRRTADNLSWCRWHEPTPEGVRDAWGCSSSVVILQVVRPTEDSKQQEKK